MRTAQITGGSAAKSNKGEPDYDQTKSSCLCEPDWLAIVSVSLLVVGNVRAAGADHVQWDIINLAFTTPPTVSAGGIAFASADATHTIRFTGSGTFVAPASGGTSS